MTFPSYSEKLQAEAERAEQVYSRLSLSKDPSGFGYVLTLDKRGVVVAGIYQTGVTAQHQDTSKWRCVQPANPTYPFRPFQCGTLTSAKYALSRIIADALAPPEAPVPPERPSKDPPEPVIELRPVPSATDRSKVYTVAIVDHIVISCTCLGWQNRHVCRHALDEQTKELDALENYPS